MKRTNWPSGVWTSIPTARRLVERASRQFRAEGMNGPGVAKLMKASGLTVGGFYKHFDSRDDLFAEAMDESVREMGEMLNVGFSDALPPMLRLRKFVPFDSVT